MMNYKIPLLELIMDSRESRMQLGVESVLFGEILEHFEWKKKPAHEKQQKRKSFVESYKIGHPNWTPMPFYENFIKAYDALERIYKDILFLYHNDLLEIKDVTVLKSLAVLLIEKDYMNENFFGELQHLSSSFMTKIMLQLKEIHPEIEPEVTYFIKVYEIMYENWVNNPFITKSKTEDTQEESRE